MNRKNSKRQPSAQSTGTTHVLSPSWIDPFVSNEASLPGSWKYLLYAAFKRNWSVACRYRSAVLRRILPLLVVSMLFVAGTSAQQNDATNYSRESTYTNPVLPGDHPDPTLLKVGKDFFHCGSSFHFTPYLPIYHSTDLVHWKVISRVLPPSKAGWVEERPSTGVWQGAITYFYGSYWIYFSSGGQWFSKAASPWGPWSDPVKVATNPATGELGYDNSIFVDDDGKPYMLIKNMQRINRMQAIGRDGQLTDTVINLDWINASLQYSWAEGPVMSKRNGYYYYFPAGDVSGGQYVLRSRALTADSTKWERLGDFFKPVTDSSTGFLRPNHIAAPLQLEDGSWWTLAQSYEVISGDDWSGTGRQTLLFPVLWEGDRPWGLAPSNAPIPLPKLPRDKTPWRAVQSDDFDATPLNLCWHFLSKAIAGRYSLEARKGWLRLLPDSNRTSILQKETDHYYTAVTRIDFNAKDTSSKAGLYLTSGNQSVNIRLYSSFDKGPVIIFQSGANKQTIPNQYGTTFWLKLTRNWHQLTAYCSKDGNSWQQVGQPIDASMLDKAQPNWNAWVGTSIGLFTEGAIADFDRFICKDGFTDMPVAGCSNQYGINKTTGTNSFVTAATNNGGWLMLSGVDAGRLTSKQLVVTAKATKACSIEVWLDGLQTGKRIATIPITKTGASWSRFGKAIANIKGQHDLYILLPTNSKDNLFIQQIRFAQ